MSSSASKLASPQFAAGRPSIVDAGALPHAEPPVDPVVALLAAEEDADPELELLFVDPCENPADEELEPLFDELEEDPVVPEPVPLPEVMF